MCSLNVHNFQEEIILSSIFHKTSLDHFQKLVKIWPDNTRFLCGEQKGRYFILLMYGSFKSFEKKTNSGNNLNNVENPYPVAQALSMPTRSPLSIHLASSSICIALMTVFCVLIPINVLLTPASSVFSLLSWTPGSEPFEVSGYSASFLGHHLYVDCVRDAACVLAIQSA